jgi:hypothetical protein
MDCAHWLKCGQPWRTEPEIDSSRQKDLAAYLTTKSDIVQGIYPFKNIKLDRACCLSNKTAHGHIW